MADKHFDYDLFSYQAPISQPSVQTKHCWACQRSKPRESFGKDAGRSDGLNPKCKECCNAAYRKRADANPRTDKECSFCHVVKPISEFDVGSGEKRTLPRKRCRECIALWGTGTPAHLRKPVPRSPNANENNRRYRQRLRDRDVIVDHEERKCVGCGEVKPAEAFYKNRSEVSGLTNRCIECKAVEGALLRQRGKGRATPETKFCDECGREKGADEFCKRGDTTDGLATYCKLCDSKRSLSYYEDNREAVIRAVWIRQKTFPERNRAERLSMRSYKRAQEFGAEGRFSAQEWLDLIAQHEYKCAYCGRDETLDFRLTSDHKIPFSRGGSNYISNIAPSCQPCNGMKRDKTPEEFAAWKEQNADILAIKPLDRERFGS